MKRIILIGLISVFLGSCEYYIQTNFFKVTKVEESTKYPGFSYYKLITPESSDYIDLRDSSGKYQVGDTVKFTK